MSLKRKIETYATEMTKLPSMGALEEQLGEGDTVLPSTPRKLSMEDHERRLLDLEEILDRDLKKQHTSRRVVRASAALVKKLDSIGFKNEELTELSNAVMAWDDGE